MSDETKARVVETNGVKPDTKRLESETISRDGIRPEVFARALVCAAERGLLREFSWSRAVPVVLALLLLASPALATDPQFGAVRIEASPNIRHAFVSTQAQSSNSNIVSKNEWNAAHTAPTQLVASVPTGMVWPAMPAAVTEFCGASTQYRWRADLTNQTSIRLTAQIVTAGAATSALRLQYTTDTSGASGWDYLDGVSGPSVSISSSGVTTSATVSLVAAAKAEVLLRLVGINGDGAGGQACYSAITAGAVAALAANGANCSSGSFPLGVDAAGAAESCTALPTTITGTANQIAASASVGGVVLSIPTNPTLPGTTSGTFSGALSGNASTATALANDAANCAAGSAPLGVDASGAVQGCFAVPSGTGTVSGNNTGDQTSVSGNAGTATALAANGGNCSPGSYPLGVDASGAAESCTAAQAQNAALQALADLTYGANTCTYYTGVGVAATMSCTAAGRSMVGAADTAAQTALLSTFTGDSGAGGVKGLVPAPAAGDAAGNKFLRASGDWTAVNTTITDNSTATSGCGAGGVHTSVSNVVQCNEDFSLFGGVLTFGTSTSAANGTITTRKTISGASAADNFFNVTGTMPTTLTDVASGVHFGITPGGSSAFRVNGQSVTLEAGYTGASGSAAGYFRNNVASTGTTVGGESGVGNVGVVGISDPNSAVTSIGVHGLAAGPTSRYAWGGLFESASPGGSGWSIGVQAHAYVTGAPVGIGGVFSASVGALGTAGTSAGYTAIRGLGGGAVDLIQLFDNAGTIPTTAASSSWNVRSGAIPQVGIGVLTTATMASGAQAYAQGSLVHSATWSNAQVAALGASTTGDIKALTIPAKHVVENAYLVITGQGAGVTTLTVSCGRTSAAYDDYITDVDAKAAANTRYGATAGERGTNLTGWDQPSYTAAADVYCHFESSGGNLSAVTGSTGRLILITTLIP